MIKSLRRFMAITQKEFRQLARDRLTFGMVVMLPLLEILLFGYAINLDVRHLKAGVADMANTHLSRTVVANAQATQQIDIVLRASSVAELEAAMQRGDIDVGLVLPPDFARRVIERKAGSDRPVGQLLVDGTSPTVARLASQLARMPVLDRLSVAELPPPVFAIRTYYNPEGRSAVFIVPALIGVILNLTMVLFTAVAIVRERERGNLELLITTPVSTTELMLGKIFPYIIIGYIQTTIILLAGIWLFDIPLRGSVAALYFAALFFIAATLSLGLVISTFAKTQFQAMQLTVFTFLPSILLSGFMFPFEGMPEFAQWLAEVLPLTHFLRLVRGIVLRGASLMELHSSIWALLAIFAVTMVMAIARFHKRLD